MKSVVTEIMPAIKSGAKIVYLKIEIMEEAFNIDCDFPVLVMPSPSQRKNQLLNEFSKCSAVNFMSMFHLCL